MSSSVRTSDVTDCLRFFVASTAMYNVDDDGYVVRNKNGERVTINVEGEPRQLIVYQERITDKEALLLNPFTEGLGSTPVSDWFFRSQSAALSWRITEIYSSVIKFAINEKSQKGDGHNSKHMPMELFNLVSTIVEDVDEKVLTEFEQIMNSPAVIRDNWVNVWYQKRLLRTVFRCALLEDNVEWRKQFSKIRQKSWVIFENIAKALFGVNDHTELDKFARKSNGFSCTRLDCFLNTMYSVYSTINVILDQIDQSISVDLETYATHVSKIQDYANNAKFMVQATPSKSPSQTSGLPSGSAIPQQNTGLLPWQMAPAQPDVPNVTNLPVVTAPVSTLPVTSLPSHQSLPVLPGQPNSQYGNVVDVPWNTAPQQYMPQQQMVHPGMMPGGMLPGNYAAQPVPPGTPMTSPIARSYNPYGQPGYQGYQYNQPMYGQQSFMPTGGYQYGPPGTPYGMRLN